MSLSMMWAVIGWLCGWLLQNRVSRLPEWDVHEVYEWNGVNGANGAGMKNIVAPAPIPLSVIIPARNEAANIGKLLNSLLQQKLSNVEIIVVDDGSEDATASLAASNGACVVPTEELPDGWIGKSWACWTGAKTAQGELLVFLDADVELADDALQLLAASQRVNGGLVSVQPYHRMERAYEQLSAFLNLIVVASVGDGDSRSGAFRPCLVCRRDDYFRIGGHEAVRGKVLEHFELGRAFSSEQIPVSNFIGYGKIIFRMYPDGLGSMFRGWSKRFAAGAASTAPFVAFAVSLWLAGAISAVSLVLSPLAGQMQVDDWLLGMGVASYAAYSLQLVLWLRKTGSFKWWTALLYPLPLGLFMLFFAYSLFTTFIRRKVTWKGRVVSMGRRERGKL
ncbi:4,4'-diaponeurosporenoate glycosyltransferase [Paenibacillus algorifonticola]|uniref:4,4'-diaponeurosporenoate glycosyltransferase n=1 Tax=Paenibacillus algorifonticola TaxID=684063 RepID=A0A1I1XPL9_9BACL|nr:glycosyltransferase family 2 protein [Paenibacillus algorifonticola]SFE09237.1 4,4'-diaponeurosporenoate glycosyltransferase [Paenibacillus algorifonticola]